MKRFAIGIILLLFAVAVSVSCFFVFDNHVERLRVSLEELLVTAQTGKPEEIERKTEDFYNLWEDVNPVLHSLVNHQGMDVLETDILALKRFLKHEEIDLFQEACVKALSQLENIRTAERLSFENIF